MTLKFQRFHPSSVSILGLPSRELPFWQGRKSRFAAEPPEIGRSPTEPAVTTRRPEVLSAQTTSVPETTAAAAPVPAVQPGHLVSTEAVSAKGAAVTGKADVQRKGGRRHSRGRSADRRSRTR